MAKNQPALDSLPNVSDTNVVGAVLTEIAVDVKMARQRLSVVAPVYNEVAGVTEFVDALFAVLDSLPYESEAILVDDGSTDGTSDLLDQLQAARSDRVTVLHFSRNFGHQAALTAGMDHADGHAVICMDADLQHPPGLIPVMVERWRQGFDVVQAVRRHTADTELFKAVTSRAFYALINRVSATHIEPNGADFRLLSRRVADVFQRDVRERDRFLRGLVAWVGFRSCIVRFDAPPRIAGQTKYSFLKMLTFARTGLVSFSRVPLKVAVLLGLFVSAVSLLYGLYAVFAYLFFSAVIPGWASTILVGTFLGGCQLLFLGVLGEYIATIFDEVKHRPLYIVAALERATNARTRHQGPDGATDSHTGDASDTA